MTTDLLSRLARAEPHMVRAWVCTITAVDQASGTCTIDPQDGATVAEVPYWGGTPVVGTIQVAFLFDSLMGVLVAGPGAPTDVWGSPPLDIYGTNDLTGQQTYLDANGRIRAQPILIDGAAANRVAADMMDKYPSGTSLVALSTAQSSAGLWPGPGSVLVTKRNSTQGTQFWMGLATVTATYNPPIKYRVNDGAVWSPWVDILSDTGWVNIAPSSGTGTLQYRYKDGIVEARANLSGMTSVAAGAAGTISPPGSIPAAYVPSVASLYQMGNGAGNTQLQIVLNLDGGLTFYNQATVATTVVRFTMVWLKE